MFFDKLKSEVKKAIIIMSCSMEFQDLINQAIKFNQLFYQQSNEEKHESHNDPSYPNKKHQNYHITNSKAPTLNS